MKHYFRLSDAQWRSVVGHLLPSDSLLESAAFLFARASCTDASRTLTVVDIALAQPQDFAHQYEDYLELTDTARVRLQKAATKLEASIIEVHSHPTQSVAAFSLADLFGFKESVPQMRWRLHDRPYGAIVMAPTSFDALVWWDTTGPAMVDAVHLGESLLTPTGRTREVDDGWRRAL